MLTWLLCLTSEFENKGSDKGGRGVSLVFLKSINVKGFRKGMNGGTSPGISERGGKIKNAPRGGET